MKLIKDKKKKLSAEEVKQQTRKKTAQQWIPIADIDEGIVYRKDNTVLSMIKVQPENIDLLSELEKRRKIDALAEGFNGENEDLQIFCVGRPVDLNDYLEDLQDKAKMEQDFTRKTILKGYIQDTSKKATSGEIMERRFYIILKKKIEDNKSISELMNRTNELENKLTQAELTCEISNDDEVLDLYSLFSSPSQAAFETTESEIALPTIMS